MYLTTSISITLKVYMNYKYYFSRYAYVPCTSDSVLKQLQRKGFQNCTPILSPRYLHRNGHAKRQNILCVFLRPFSTKTSVWGSNVWSPGACSTQSRNIALRQSSRAIGRIVRFVAFRKIRLIKISCLNLITTGVIHQTPKIEIPPLSL